MKNPPEIPEEAEKQATASHRLCQLVGRFPALNIRLAVV
jgi:hypothetical protein